MPANIQPIYTRVPDIQWSTSALTVANTSVDLTGGTSYLVFTSDATNGGFVQRIRFRALGTNSATVARIFINNGATTGTAANNILWDEITLNSTTLTQTSSLAVQELPLNFGLPAGYRIYVTLGAGAGVGNPGWSASIIGGKY
jgi:hypothetical protein